jgi:hypothetical protein
LREESRRQYLLKEEERKKREEEYAKQKQERSRLRLEQEKEEKRRKEEERQRKLREEEEAKRRREETDRQKIRSKVEEKLARLRLEEERMRKEIEIAQRELKTFEFSLSEFPDRDLGRMQEEIRRRKPIAWKSDNPVREYAAIRELEEKAGELRKDIEEVQIAKERLEERTKTLSIWPRICDREIQKIERGEEEKRRS